MDFEAIIRAEWSKTIPTIKSKQDVLVNLQTEFEKQLLQFVIHKSSGNSSRAAEYLGVNRNTLRKRCASQGINIREIRQKFIEDNN